MRRRPTTSSRTGTTGRRSKAGATSVWPVPCRRYRVARRPLHLPTEPASDEHSLGVVRRGGPRQERDEIVPLCGCPGDWLLSGSPGVGGVHLPADEISEGDGDVVGEEFELGAGVAGGSASRTMQILELTREFDVGAVDEEVDVRGGRWPPAGTRCPVGGRPSWGGKRRDRRLGPSRGWTC